MGILDFGSNYNSVLIIKLIVGAVTLGETENLLPSSSWSYLNCSFPPCFCSDQIRQLCIKNVLPFDANSIFRKAIIYLDISTLSISNKLINRETYRLMITCINNTRNHSSDRISTSFIHFSADMCLLGMIVWTVRGATDLQFLSFLVNDCNIANFYCVFLWACFLSINNHNLTL